MSPFDKVAIIVAFIGSLVGIVVTAWDAGNDHGAATCAKLTSSL